jgi:hypothetical protein
MAKQLQQFQQIYERFEEYKRSNTVPAVIDLKLQLLASCIRGNACQSNLSLLDTEER